MPNPSINWFFFETRLTIETMTLAARFEAVCVFVNDQLDETVLQAIYEAGSGALVGRVQPE
jgi:D-lactate dehydrogenase